VGDLNHEANELSCVSLRLSVTARITAPRQQEKLMITKEFKAEARELTDDQLDTIAGGGKPLSLFEWGDMIVNWWNTLTGGK
jgi:hypothetical protein